VGLCTFSLYTGNIFLVNGQKITGQKVTGQKVTKLLGQKVTMHIFYPAGQKSHNMYTPRFMYAM